MTYELHETCMICNRVRWGNYQYVGKGHWRHEECRPGSENWKEYYKGLKPNKQTSAGNLLLGEE